MSWGLLISALAKSAIHEIEAFIFYLIAAVLFSAFAILHRVQCVREELQSNGLKLDQIAANTVARPPRVAPLPPPTPEAQGAKYLVHISDAEQGTFTRAQIEELLARGTITLQTYVRRDGSLKWLRVGELEAPS